MRIALVQMACEWGAVEANLRRAERHIREGRARGADLVVFPEMSVHGMWKEHLVRLAAEPLDGPIVRRMARLAKQHALPLGFGLAERSAGRPFNTFVVVDRRGRTVAAYRKNTITPLERDYFRAGTRRPVFRLNGVRTAVAICADTTNRDLLMGYGRRGVKLVLMPHAWDADPILRDGRIAAWRNVEDMVDHFARGRVIRYRTHDEMRSAFLGRVAPVCRAAGFAAALVNQVGRPYPLTPFVGPSFVLDRMGNVVAESQSDCEGILVADLDLP